MLPHRAIVHIFPNKYFWGMSHWLVAVDEGVIAEANGFRFHLLFLSD